MARTKSIRAALPLIIACLLCAACLAKLPYVSKTNTTGQDETEYEAASPAPSKQVDNNTPERPEPKDRKILEDKKQDRMKQAQPEPKSGEKTEKKKPEDEADQVKAAALEKAKDLGNIKKAKVCYASKDKEWWVVFYQDTDSAIDVRQFFWHPETERLEPFLVLKRIPRDKMESDFKKDEPGKTCSNLAVPKDKRDMPKGH